MNRNIDIQLKQYAQHTKATGEPFGSYDYQQIYQRAGGDVFRAIDIALRYGYAVGYRKHRRKSGTAKNRPLRIDQERRSEGSESVCSCNTVDPSEGETINNSET